MFARRTCASHPNHQYIHVQFEDDTRPKERPIAIKHTAVQEPESSIILSNSHLSDDIRSCPIPIPITPASGKKQRARKQYLQQQQLRHRQKEIRPDPHHEYPYTLLPSEPPTTTERRTVAKTTTITVTTTEKAKYPLNPEDVTELEPPQVSKIHAHAERKSLRQDPAIDPSFGALREGVVVYGNGHWVLEPNNLETVRRDEDSPAQKSLRAVDGLQKRLAVSVARGMERYYDDKAAGDVAESLAERLGL